MTLYKYTLCYPAFLTFFCIIVVDTSSVLIANAKISGNPFPFSRSVDPLKI